MTDHGINIAVANACGWKFVPLYPDPETTDGFFYLWPSESDVELAKVGRLKGATPTYKLPNYVADLNACHEMEKVLLPSEKQRYWNVLGDVISDNGNKTLTLRELTFATARQRCEAFLRTIGKWRDA